MQLINQLTQWIINIDKLHNDKLHNGNPYQIWQVLLKIQFPLNDIL